MIFDCNFVKYSCIYGFTLIELLVVSALSSILAIALGHLLIGSWQAFRYQVILTESQEAAYVFFEVIEQNLIAAGFTDRFPINWSLSSTGIAGDQLSLQYDSSNRTDRNCLGNSETGFIVNTYYLRSSEASPYQTDDIMCSAGSSSDTLVQYVELMKVRYGLDKGRFINGVFVDQPDGLVDSWVTQVREAERYTVLAMEIALITKSNFNDKSTGSIRVDNVWGQPLDGLGIDVNDGYFRLLHTARFNFS